LLALQHYSKKEANYQELGNQGRQMYTIFVSGRH